MEESTAERLRELERLCREKGLPLTIQRRAVLEAVLERSDHPTADQVHEAVQQVLPDVSRTTVYRTLETLVELGLVRRVHQTGTPGRFDGKTYRHHHLVCSRCGKMADIEAPELNELALPEEAHGFRVDDYMVQLIGVCAECRKQGP